MPRLRPSLLWRACRISPNLARLLPVCRDVPSALNELRWIRKHAQSIYAKGNGRHYDRLKFGILVKHICVRRGLGEPLQYLLGTQPFGELDIRCRPGVLIPRPETEAYTIHLADLIRLGGLPALGSAHDIIQRGGLRILDLCTGTGCIPLLLTSRLVRRGLVSEVRGVDISSKALSLAQDNTARNRELIQNFKPRFQKLDVFADYSFSARSLRDDGSWDIVTCNPPYISEAGFARDTSRSVRNFEPRNANVPEDQDPCGLYDSVRPEDIFYARVLDLCRQHLRPKVVFFEVGDLEQAKRAAAMALQHENVRVEIWRDIPDDVPSRGNDKLASVNIDGVSVTIKGSGHGRGVLVQYHDRGTQKGQS